ncbi:aldo/keto reductase [Oceanispirochaeta sp.]|jgi:predicted aldo/keto reductase-like oxidoreductase|uniref:aldo/keto reductase n=1 Tax=Oceanispirochaeta sp. TaxID=2035350 RepID=UPI002616D197|nr:aldo/keto reductase [Oceanispirochaeta sp.]MDA3955271.1 aldo/keto reductase [Oceanispirochaeta sp.]
MLYRKFGKTNEKLSILGFGAMRLPIIEGDVKHIDEEKALKMIRHSIDLGVNYLDTAWPYHGGNSESFCGKVMQDGYRDKVKIATKLPSWEIKSPGDMDRILDQQLERLGVETIDFYLLHSLNAANWANMKKHDYKSFLIRSRAAGKIRYTGFSHHDDIDLFKEIVDDNDWDFCQIQLNYLDEHYQAGLEGMDYAVSKGMGVVVMEPLRGGMLARTEIPEELQSIWDASDTKRSPAEWALRSLWDREKVGVILSGMTTMEQVQENLKVAGEALPGTLTEKENNIIGKAKDYFHSKIRVDCTNCRYCMPCPQGVYIPEIFWAYNHEALFDDFAKAKFWTTGFLKEQQRASNCNSCGQCEKHCPQNIEIRRHLKDVAARYEAAVT